MLKIRILSTILLAPIPLLAIWFGSPWFDSFVILIAALMAWEWENMLRGRFGVPGAIIAAVVCPAVIVFGFSLTFSLSILAIASLLFMAGLRYSNFERWKLLSFGIPYIGFPILSLVYLNSFYQISVLYWLLAVVWATDIGAYIFGSWLRGPLLAPKISPKKTWAGLIGGMFSAGLVGFVTSYILKLDSFVSITIISSLMAVVAQIGDLLESMIKRHLNVKDSGKIIPGHGGLFDRLDGLFAVSPVVAIIVWLSGNNIFGLF